MTAIRELLPLYALGLLESDEASLVEREMASDPSLAAELETYRDAALEIVAPAAPSPDAKARLMASAGGGRFERFADRVAKLFDVTLDRGRELLGLIERAASWENRAPGIGLIHFEGGPAVVTADCGFVKIAPGMIFPWHAHVGDELSIVLVGTLQENTGRFFRPGDEVPQAAGSEHCIKAEDEEVIFATRAFDGITISGVRQR